MKRIIVLIFQIIEKFTFFFLSLSYYPIYIFTLAVPKISFIHLYAFLYNKLKGGKSFEDIDKNYIPKRKKSMIKIRCFFHINFFNLFI